MIGMNTEATMTDYMTRGGQIMPAAARRKIEFCSPVPQVAPVAVPQISFEAAVSLTNIPLRIKQEFAAAMLADSEFKATPTEDLIYLAMRSKHVHVSDRASAIRVIKGLK